MITNMGGTKCRALLKVLHVNYPPHSSYINPLMEILVTHCMDREAPKRVNDFPKATGLAGGRAKILSPILHHNPKGVAKGKVQESFIFYF